MDDAQSNIEVVEAALVAIQDGDMDGALSRMEEDARWGVARSLPEGGLHTGRDEIREMFAAVRERFPGGYRFLHLTVHGTKDHVFAEATRSAGAERAEGAEHVLVMFHVVMGKIREAREFVYEVR